MKNVRDIIIILAVLALLFVVFTRRPREVVRYERTIDTLVVRDTVVKRVPQPYRVDVVRTDTILISVPEPPDSINTLLPSGRKHDGEKDYSPEAEQNVKITLPIERREYRDEEYYAVIEGYRPELVSMTVYPKTKYITDTQQRTTTKRSRWGVGIQAGYGYGFTANKPIPYIGIGIQYNLFTW